MKHEEWSDRKDQYICPECEDSYIHWFMNPEIEEQAVKWDGGFQ